VNNKFDDLDDYEEFEYLENLSTEEEIDEKNKNNKEKIAIALRFDPEKDTAPRIVAAGRGEVAEEIIELAEESNVPVYQEKTIAEGLAQVEVGAVIPGALYELIAEVLIFLYYLNEDWLDEKLGEDFDIDTD